MMNDFMKKYFGNVIGLTPTKSPSRPLLKKGVSDSRLVKK